MAIADVIEEAKAAYRAAGLDCADALLPPADDTAIDAITKKVLLPVPPELRAVYRVHGGQEYVSPGNSGLFGEHRLFTPVELVEWYTMTCETSEVPEELVEWYTGSRAISEVPEGMPENPAGDGPPYWDRQLLPFALWNDVLLCIHAQRGDVWMFRPYDGLTYHWPSIEAVLGEAIAGVQAQTAEKLSWKGHLPAGARDVHEWVEVSGFLPTVCWCMLKARVNAAEYIQFVTQFELRPIQEFKKYDLMSRTWLWEADVGFDDNWWDHDTWWDPSLERDSTLVAEDDDSSFSAKYEDGFLYFKAYRNLTDRE